MKKIINKHIETLKENKITKFFFGNPILKFVILVVLHILASSISNYLAISPIKFILVIIDFLIAIYFILLVIYVIRKSFNSLMNPSHLPSLILAYAFFVLSIILIFSTIFNLVYVSNLGNIQYGGCSNNFDPNSISTNPNISKDFFYFSAITFFTVGYGDICPMGFAKIISIIASFVGHVISLILVALIINRYIAKKDAIKN